MRGITAVTETILLIKREDPMVMMMMMKMDHPLMIISLPAALHNMLLINFSLKRCKQIDCELKKRGSEASLICGHA